MNKPLCYTIGHSHHDYQAFFSLLDRFSIRCLVDVRTYPYSKYAPQFNKQDIRAEALNRGLEYIYEGAALGGKYTNPEFLSSEFKVDYKKVSKSPVFQEAVGRLVDICLSSVTVLMCGEKDFFLCHRFFLDSRALWSRGIEVAHISAEGDLLMHSCWEREALAVWERKHSQYSLFQDDFSRETALDRIYAGLAGGKSF